MKQQISNIIIAGMLCGTALYATGAFEKPTYATVHFDGGYQVLGEIGGQSYTSNVKITKEGNTLHEGTISEVIESIHKAAANSDQPIDTASFVAGVKVDAYTGVRWEASQANFTLQTDWLKEESTEEKGISVADLISRLESMETRIKQEQQTQADQALTFSQPPSNSFFFSRLASLLRN